MGVVADAVAVAVAVDVAAAVVVVHLLCEQPHYNNNNIGSL